jgi:hypothetical protein
MRRYITLGRLLLVIVKHDWIFKDASLFVHHPDDGCFLMHKSIKRGNLDELWVNWLRLDCLFVFSSKVH